MSPLALLFLALFVRTTYVAHTIDAIDGTQCDVYRIGRREVNVCENGGGL